MLHFQQKWLNNEWDVMWIHRSICTSNERMFEYLEKLLFEYVRLLEIVYSFYEFYRRI